MRRKKVIYKTLLYVALLSFTLIIAFPFIYMLSGSFKNDVEIVRKPLAIIPEQPTLNNFVELFNRMPFMKQMLNSTLVALTASILTMFFSSLVAYGYVRFEFKGKNALFVIMLSTMMVPPQALMIPQFKMFQSFGWLNTYYPLIIPFAISAFGVFLIRSVMVSIPKDIFENANIDGCSEFFICMRIAIPLAKTGIIIQGILTFMQVWNDFMTPLIYLTRENLYTLTIGLSTLVGFYDVEYGIPMAGALLSALPVIIILNIVGQKYFVEGMMAGAVKG